MNQTSDLNWKRGATSPGMRSSMQRLKTAVNAGSSATALSLRLPEYRQKRTGRWARLWLYTNFDCNLHCDYCCVRSSPTVPRRELGLARVQRIAREASELGVKEIFVTGGEPFLLEDIGEILVACAAATPTTVLTNGMLFTGRRAESLRALPRDRVVLQISLDSATPQLHDRHRGHGTGARAREGIQRARAQGFRVRLAATVSTDAEAVAFRE